MWRGALAGAAGTTVLNGVSYLDMAARGRGASDTPQQLAGTVADRVGVELPGTDDERENRLAGIGPLLGVGVGVAVGSVTGALDRAFRSRGRQIPAPLLAILAGGAAMALSDVPLKAYGLSDPATWSGKDWASDVLPHLAYGLATVATLRASE